MFWMFLLFWEDHQSPEEHPAENLGNSTSTCQTTKNFGDNTHALEVRT